MVELTGALAVAVLLVGLWASESAGLLNGGSLPQATKLSRVLRASWRRTSAAWGRQRRGAR